MDAGYFLGSQMKVPQRLNWSAKVDKRWNIVMLRIYSLLHILSILDEYTRGKP